MNTERCDHCDEQYPPVTGGSDVCDCPCHKSSYFQDAVEFWRRLALDAQLGPGEA